MTILESLARAITIYSIDEAFCDLSGMGRLTELDAFGQQLREQIKRRTHLTVG